MFSSISRSDKCGIPIHGKDCWFRLIEFAVSRQTELTLEEWVEIHRDGNHDVFTIIPNMDAFREFQQWVVTTITRGVSSQLNIFDTFCNIARVTLEPDGPNDDDQEAKKFTYRVTFVKLIRLELKALRNTSIEAKSSRLIVAKSREYILRHRRVTSKP